MIARVLLSLLLFSALGAHAQTGADVGLVNLLSGEVSYAAGGAGAPGKAQAFMKVRQGDRFDLAAGATLRVVYFDGGRQETWTGPAAFRAGAREGEAISGGKPVVAQLPAGVPQKMRQVPELVQIAKLSRAGGVSVRGLTPKQQLSLELQREVNEARETYRKMAAEAPANDITPELYLYSVLQEYLLYDDMVQVAEEMQRKQPGSTEVQSLLEWARNRGR